MMAMIRCISTVVIVAGLGGAAVPAALAEPAAADGWRVLESHGGARFQPAGDPSWWPARTGSHIPHGSIVATGSSGFVIIARPGESITVHPDSRVALPGEAGDEVHQATGDLRYRITRVPDRRFAVETPYLSLLVKGTVFEVAVGERGAAVEVAEGRVRVDAARGQAVELSPGQGARIGPGPQADLEFRAAPESPFVAAAPSPRAAVAAAYTRHASVRATAERPSAAGRETHRAARADSGLAESAPVGDAADTAHGPEGTAIGSLADPPDGAADAGRDGGIEIGFSEGRMWIDTARAQIDEVAPRQDPVVSGLQVELPSGIASERAAAAPLPRPQTAAAAPSGADAGDSGLRPQATAQPGGRAVQAAAGGWRGSDTVVWAILAAVAATLWWRLRRSPNRPSSGQGAGWRWPWQRPSLAPSGASGSTIPGSGSHRSVRSGT